MSPRPLRSALLLLAVLAACADAPPPALSPAEAAAQDSVIAALRAADRQRLDAAFDALAVRPHTVHERLEQVHPTGEVFATRTRTLRVEGGTARVLAADSAGAFDLGTLGRFVSLDTVDRLPANPVPHLLPDDPPYLGSRARETYAFAAGPDTVVAGRGLRVLTARARPGEGDDLALREAVLFVEPASGAVVGLRIRRNQASPLFGETSTLAVQLAPAGGDGWLPETARYDVALRAPLAAQRRFRLTRTYAYDDAPYSMLHP